MDEELRELRRRCDRLERLNSVSRVIHSSLEPGEALELILGQALLLMQASSGSIALLNPTTGLLEIEAARGLSARGRRLRLKPGEGVTGWVLRTGRPARIGDVRKDPRSLAARRSVRSELAVPLEVNGEVRGVLDVGADRVAAFGAEDEVLLQDLASQAAVVIHHTWLYEQLRLKARLFESLLNVGQTINSAIGLEDALRRVTREAGMLMGARTSSLRLLDSTGEWLELQASHGAGAGYLRMRRLSVAESLVGVVVRRKKPHQIENVQVSNRYQNAEVARREGLVSLLSVPLVFGGVAIGVLSVYTGTPHVFSNEEVRILQALADLSAIAIEKARLYERVVDAEEQLRHNEKLSVLGLLAAEVAHEIRNPLTVMKLLYHSLDLHFPERDPRARDVQIITEKMEQLNRIVDRVLDFARRSEPRLAPVRLRGLLEELGLLIRHKFVQQGIRLVFRLVEDLPAVMADAGQLGQAFLNLMLNAAEAMPGGGCLTIRGQPDADSKAGGVTHVRLEFRDTGVGMTAEQCQGAFSAFLGSTKPRGTGLGLAIVARMIEAHHGEISVHSRAGAGTAFRIRLPLLPPG